VSARAALELIYARRGYGATRVLLAEQEIKDGVIRLRVVEVKLGGIRPSASSGSSDGDGTTSRQRDWSGSRLCRNAGENGRWTGAIEVQPRRLRLTPRGA
jgi:hypothetical protein